MSDKIVLHIADHSYNAGLVGLVNILGEHNVELDADTLSFSAELLNDFQDKYFHYFIKRYEKSLSWYKIVSFKSTIEMHEMNGFSQFDEHALERFNKYIKDVLKYYLKSNSYKAAYALISDSRDMLVLEKQLTTVGKLKKKESFKEKREEIIEEVKNMSALVKEAIDYCESTDGKKYLAGKNVVYTVIKNGWNGVSFLNPQTKEKDMYLDYADYFLEPAKAYLTDDKEKYVYHCVNCNLPIKDLKNDLSFLNVTGFDTARKTSHVWDFQNDTAICPICKLVYSCIPAGFTYAFDQGLFINASGNLKQLVAINQTMQFNVLDAQLEEKMNTDVRTYRGMILALQQDAIKRTSYEAEGVTIVRYENETYRFNILPDVALNTIYSKSTQLTLLTRTGFKEINTSFSLYKLVIQKLLNRESLFTLLHKLIVYKVTNIPNLYYHEGHLLDLNKINAHFLGGLGRMSKEEEKFITVEKIEQARKMGWWFKQEYANENKVKGIAHQLLNALKVNDKNLFMDVILRCYVYLNKQVPDIFTKMLNDDVVFKTLGYAFVIGIIGKNDKKEKAEVTS